MKKELSYKGYYGSVEYSLEDDVLYGKVIGIKGLLSYEGQTLDELRKDIEKSGLMRSSQHAMSVFIQKHFPTIWEADKD